MSRRNKKNRSPNKVTHPTRRDIYNVKENLNKLKSGTGREAYSTESDPLHIHQDASRPNTNQSHYTSSSLTASTVDKLDHLNDRLSSDISTLKDSFSDYKDTLNDKLDLKVNKVDFYRIIGIIVSSVMVLASIIYTLSYQGLIETTKELQNQQNQLNRRLDKFEIIYEQRIQGLESKITNSVNIETSDSDSSRIK